MVGVTKDTTITLSNGLSVPIPAFSKKNNIIFGWSDKHNGIIESKNSSGRKILHKECVELILQDGRSIKCASDTELLTSENQWVEAQNLVGDELYRLKIGLNSATSDFRTEMKECKGWELKMKITTLRVETLREYLQALAFARLLGYILTDGSIYFDKSRGHIYSSVVMGNQFDADAFVTDVELITGIRPNSNLHNNVYYIHLPRTFVDNISSLKGILVGRRSIQPGEWPAFILDPNCPKPIIREFIGGLWGGDGETCCLGRSTSGGMLTSVAFSQTKSKTHLASLKVMLEQLQQLFGKFGIHHVSIHNPCKATINKPINFVDHESSPITEEHFNQCLYISIEDIIIFAEQIGFRYCVHKQHRLEAAISYRRFRDNVIRQDKWITDRTAEITNYIERMNLYPNNRIHVGAAIEQATQELESKEPLLHECSVPTPLILRCRLRQGKEGNMNGVRFTRIPDYLKQIDAIGFFIYEMMKVGMPMGPQTQKKIPLRKKLVKKPTKLNMVFSAKQNVYPHLILKYFLVAPSANKMFTTSKQTSNPSLQMV
jgi:hypothetical protein